MILFYPKFMRKQNNKMIPCYLETNGALQLLWFVIIMIIIKWL